MANIELRPSKAVIDGKEYQVKFWIESQHKDDHRVYFRLDDTSVLGLDTDKRVSLLENSYADYVNFRFNLVKGFSSVYQLDY